MDLALVVDVNTNPANTVIGDRAFGTDPRAAGAAAAAFITALQARGVAACAKHWPGHGDTVEDSLRRAPSLAHDIRRLRDVEMRPFRDAIAANVASVLVAHLLVPAMEPSGARPVPASASAAVVGALRRDEGFDRLVMTDDMEMGAMRAYGLGDAAVRGLAAGVDMFLVCHSEPAQMEVLDALTAALAEGKISRVAAEAATETRPRRVRRLRRTRAAGPRTRPGSVRGGGHGGTQEKIGGSAAVQVVTTSRSFR